MDEYHNSDDEEGHHICCGQWHRDAETIATERIKRRAKTSCLSKLVCCERPNCFERHNILCLYIFSGFAFGILLIATAAYAGLVYYPALYTQHFQKTSCQVESIVYNENLTSTCRWTKDEDSGTIEYKCLRIYVNYQLKGAKNRERNVTHYSALFFDTYGDMVTNNYPLRCTNQPGSCSEGDNLDSDIEVYYRHFLDYIRNNTYTCFYNPDNPKEVIGTEEQDVGTARGYLTLIAGLFTFIFLLLIFMCCTCGSQYICCTGETIPQEIEQEMEIKRTSEMQRLTAAATPAAAIPTGAAPAAPIGGRGPVVYVGTPVQVVPIVPGAGQPQTIPPKHQPGQPPVGPQYGQYPAPQPGYPAPAQPAYPPPQPGYQPPPPGQYPPPQPGAYGPPGAYPAPQPGAYPPGAYAAWPPQPQPGEQPPPYESTNATAPELPLKPPASEEPARATAPELPAKPPME